jgi:hypothetical protein
LECLQYRQGAEEERCHAGSIRIDSPRLSSRGEENMSGMLTHSGDDGPGRRGCGPLIAPLSESMRPLRQQVFERVRASGLMPRVQVAKELGVSPASVTTITSELIELGLLEEVTVPRETDTGRGRPPWRWACGRTRISSSA